MPAGNERTAKRGNDIETQKTVTPMKKSLIILGIMALIAGGCNAYIPLGMCRSVEKQLSYVSLHSVRNATNHQPTG